MGRLFARERLVVIYFSLHRTLSKVTPAYRAEGGQTQVSEKPRPYSDRALSPRDDHADELLRPVAIILPVTSVGSLMHSLALQENLHVTDYNCDKTQYSNVMHN
jgi:hypothetical protein